MSPDDMPRFLGMVAQLDPNYKRAEAKVDQLSADGLHYFEELFAPIWKVSHEGELLILERV